MQRKWKIEEKHTKCVARMLETIAIKEDRKSQVHKVECLTFTYVKPYCRKGLAESIYIDYVFLFPMIPCNNQHLFISGYLMHEIISLMAI